jgi:hypothetical protein
MVTRDRARATAAVEHGLHPWVGFVIVPVFALASAGVALRGEIGATVTGPTTIESSSACVSASRSGSGCPLHAVQDTDAAEGCL